MTAVKICGVGDRDSALAAAAAGADLLGFHFCSSRRRIAPEEARDIAAEVRAQPGRAPEIVGVFIDPSEDEVEATVRLVGLDRVQLHGREEPGFRASRPILKVLRVRDSGMEGDGDWPDPIILDSWSADGRGGTGRTWRWDLAEALAGRRAVILAGGLTPDNVGDAVRTLRPYGVDVSSGVEVGIPGSKDPALMTAFVQAVRRVDVPVRR